jgi:GT2 family glycosyltransferase
VTPPPVVSIITPAYNAAEFIGETARSVLQQTFTDWEWIVVDDGSSDETCRIVESFADPRVRLIRAEHSGLPAVARNRGVAEARGTYVAYLDADDVWLPEKLALQTAAFSDDVGVVICEFQYLFGSQLRQHRFPDLRGVPNPGDMFEALSFANFICNSTVVVRRSLLDTYGAMDEDPRQRGTEDYELWLRLAAVTQFACVMQPLVRYRIHAHGVSRNARAITEGRILAVEKAAARDPRLHPQLQGDGLAAWQAHWRAVARSYDGSGDCGRREFIRALRIRPHIRSLAGLVLSFLGPAINRRVRRIAERIL